MMTKIFVIVNEGEARVCTETVPENIVVEVIDLDMIRHGNPFPSVDAFNFCQKFLHFPERRKRDNQREGGRRDEDLALAAA